MLYRVSGCNVSAVVENTDSMLWWINRIIQKGGTPAIVPFFPELERKAA